MSLINSIGKPFTELSSIDSTNNYAMAQAQNGAGTHGAAWFAHHQMSGRGQYGKQWNAAEGENILMSVLLQTVQAAISSQFLLSMATALAVHDFISFHTNENIKIKWPNDIYCDDRKAAGILIENIIRGNVWQWAVAGIGVNINQTLFDKTLKNPVSLKHVTGKNYDVITLAKELCVHLQTRFEQFINHEQIKLLYDYNELLYKRGEIVKLKIKSKNIIEECNIKEVNLYGELIVSGGYKPSYTFGEVEWIIS